LCHEIKIALVGLFKGEGLIWFLKEQLDCLRVYLQTRLCIGF